MRSFLAFLFILFNFAALAGIQRIDSAILGEQPNAAIDTKGVVRIAFGKGKQIYCMTSTTNGNSFSKPVLVAELSGMHLGHTRGPQIASSKNYSIITAMDETGDIHSYLLKHQSGGWKSAAEVNDIRGSAPEGLMALTADKEDNFYAVWLDLRLSKQNNIYLSKANGNGKWTKNKLVYQSPEGHVCECCKPNIAFNAGKLAITFRNWLTGSRDIYYTWSVDKGETFSIPTKAGTGTWKLNGCPMDGGGLSINDKGLVSTSWQRNGEVFFWGENFLERRLSSGRDVNMSQDGGSPVVAWQANGNIIVMNLDDNTTKDLGKGSSPKLYIIDRERSLCIWEENKQVRYQIL
ncbi:hypothetical protein [Pedobacter sp. JCM 36344]|uniref:hypothetical protein n=1 Tax=Pedobacter sp. JCM 36344 TaxID=3374280 RepID=UPI003978E75B